MLLWQLHHSLYNPIGSVYRMHISPGINFNISELSKLVAHVDRLPISLSMLVPLSWVSFCRRFTQKEKKKVSIPPVEAGLEEKTPVVANAFALKTTPWGMHFRRRRKAHCCRCESCLRPEATLEPKTASSYQTYFCLQPPYTSSGWTKSDYRFFLSLFS